MSKEQAYHDKNLDWDNHPQNEADRLRREKEPTEPEPGEFTKWFDKVFGDPNHPEIIKRRFERLFALLEFEPEPGEFTKKARIIIAERKSLLTISGTSGLVADSAFLTTLKIYVDLAEEACALIDRLNEEIKWLSMKSRRFGKCPNGHITVYVLDKKPHCAVADCSGPVYEIVIEVEYAQLQAELSFTKQELGAAVLEIKKLKRQQSSLRVIAEDRLKMLTEKDYFSGCGIGYIEQALKGETHGTNRKTQRQELRPGVRADDAGGTGMF